MKTKPNVSIFTQQCSLGFPLLQPGFGKWLARMRLGLQRAAASWGVPCSSRWRWASRDVGNWRCLSSPSDGKSLEKPDVQKLAEMARISVSEAEVGGAGS